MNGNERGVKGVELLAVFGTSMSKGFLDSGVPETIKGRNIPYFSIDNAHDAN